MAVGMGSVWWPTPPPRELADTLTKVGADWGAGAAAKDVSDGRALYLVLGGESGKMTNSAGFGYVDGEFRLCMICNST